ncbi:hypothetical protein FGE25_21575 [Kosakonia sacchari]|nr:hypothetical protein FGE25_21575 [Kosakonia sacchari]
MESGSDYAAKRRTNVLKRCRRQSRLTPKQ